MRSIDQYPATTLCQGGRKPRHAQEPATGPSRDPPIRRELVPEQVTPVLTHMFGCPTGITRATSARSPASRARVTPSTLTGIRTLKHLTADRTGQEIALAIRSVRHAHGLASRDARRTWINNRKSPPPTRTRASNSFDGNPIHDYGRTRRPDAQRAPPGHYALPRTTRQQPPKHLLRCERPMTRALPALRGISARTSASQPRRALSETRPANGDDRDRTGDPLLAKQVLSQLSYAPVTHRPSPARHPQPIGTANNQPWQVWAREDLNLRPHAYQACALTN